MKPGAQQMLVDKGKAPASSTKAFARALLERQSEPRDVSAAGSGWDSASSAPHHSYASETYAGANPADTSDTASSNGTRGREANGERLTELTARPRRVLKSRGPPKKTPTRYFRKKGRRKKPPRGRVLPGIFLPSSWIFPTTRTNGYANGYAAPGRRRRRTPSAAFARPPSAPVPPPRAAPRPSIRRGDHAPRAVPFGRAVPGRGFGGGGGRASRGARAFDRGAVPPRRRCVGAVLLSKAASSRARASSTSAFPSASAAPRCSRTARTSRARRSPSSPAKRRRRRTELGCARAATRSSSLEAGPLASARRLPRSRARTRLARRSRR